MSNKKEYHIEYKKLIKTYLYFIYPIYDFYFCIIETTSKKIYIDPSYNDFMLGFIDEFYIKKTEKIIERYIDEKEAVDKLYILNKYNS